MAGMVGLQIKVKGTEKTAYSAVQYVSGIVHNLEGVDITLPDGTVIPQLLVPDTMPQQATYSTKQARATRKAKDLVAAAKATNTTAPTPERIVQEAINRDKLPASTYIYLGIPIPPGWLNNMAPAREKI